MRKELILAMALRVGQVIDKDTAVSILSDLFPDRAWAPERFGSLEVEGYRIQCERMGDVLTELDLQHSAQYAETEKHRAGIPMNPDYDGMMDAERAGALIQFTIRNAAGELVGNMRVKIMRSMHTQTLFCKEDTYYLAPEHRGSMLAVRLWQFVERSAVDVVGVRQIEFDSKLVNKADMMARYLKYEPVATKFVKTFL